MKVHLERNMTMIRRLDGLQQVKYLKEFGDICKRLGKCLVPVPVNQKQLTSSGPTSLVVTLGLTAP